MKPTKEELDRRFIYDEETGDLITLRGEKIAGYVREDGYVHVQFNYKSYYAHCIIWCMMTGEWPTHEVDHVDLCRSNNRWPNLRDISSSRNAFGRGGDHPMRGVEIIRDRYRARIVKEGTQYHLGMFDTPEEAKEAYNKAALELYGELPCSAN